MTQLMTQIQLLIMLFLGTPPTKRARRSSEPSFEIKVIKESRKSLVACGSKMYSLNESMVRRWSLMGNALEKSSKSPKLLKSLGRIGHDAFDEVSKLLNEPY